MLEDWDIDLAEHRRTADLVSRTRRPPPKLVHKLKFSMPPGTPPERLLAAVKNFAREEFALKHRYAMVLHTDEPHPHVHMVVKAVSEEGVRLNIRKATLRLWRREFARHLRTCGVEANATDRAVRGETESNKRDGIYRAALRGESRHARYRTESVARAIRFGGYTRAGSGSASLLDTRRKVQEGWEAVGDILTVDGQPALAQQVRRFAAEMPPALTDQERIARLIREHVYDARTGGGPATR